MSHDALFQLGMGSVSLNATQKEDFLNLRALDARPEAVHSGIARRPGSWLAALAARLRHAAPAIGRNSGTNRLLLRPAAGIP